MESNRTEDRHFQKFESNKIQMVLLMNIAISFSFIIVTETMIEKLIKNKSKMLMTKIFENFVGT